MNSSTEDKAKGMTKEAIGTVKEKTGEAVGNPKLETEGVAQKAEGQVQRKVGEAKDLIGE
jgi:uncharacterized protein YjbJ (UPF0337 family)